MAKDLTVKQKKFVKAYVANDGNGREAVKKVYNVANDNVASAISSQNLTKLNVKEAIDAALEKHGITMDAAIKPIADGLEATKFYGNDDSGHMDADHSVRLKAASMALKLMGAENKEAEPKGNTFVFNQNPTFNSGNYKD
ncbi:MAG: hypothetical protein EOO27_02310 [Comamonadaceae bacterium]|nr:MAG: hypothetical protein EOO27_02310 [Comamonadaceae bacterium]